MPHVEFGWLFRRPLPVRRHFPPGAHLGRTRSGIAVATVGPVSTAWLPIEQRLPFSSLQSSPASFLEAAEADPSEANPLQVSDTVAETSRDTTDLAIATFHQLDAQQRSIAVVFQTLH